MCDYFKNCRNLCPLLVWKVNHLWKKFVIIFWKYNKTPKLDNCLKVMHKELLTLMVSSQKDTKNSMTAWSKLAELLYSIYSKEFLYT